MLFSSNRSSQLCVFGCRLAAECQDTVPAHPQRDDADCSEHAVCDAMVERYVARGAEDQRHRYHQHHPLHQASRRLRPIPRTAAQRARKAVRLPPKRDGGQPTEDQPLYETDQKSANAEPDYTLLVDSRSTCGVSLLPKPAVYGDEAQAHDQPPEPYARIPRLRLALR